MCPVQLIYFWPLWGPLWLAGAATATAERWRPARKPSCARPTSSPRLKLCVQMSPHKPSQTPSPPAAPTPLHLV
jgi:hypothetical protein